MEQADSTGRNFNTISPSARSLLLMKGHTNIPYARETAELLAYPEQYIPDFENRDVSFWARTVHFENRYWCIDTLLDELPVSNILELSSGFSFRSMHTIRKRKAYYIDTDLPELIRSKKQLMEKIRSEETEVKGTLELLPLNALDEETFREIVSYFPAGELAIVNEGLLMYLDMDEKEKLCKIIHSILAERGGYWITGDIYRKNMAERTGIRVNRHDQDFFERHNIEENKFGSFDDAREFFTRMGFMVEKEAFTAGSRLSSLQYLMRSVDPEQLSKFGSAGKIQATWRLKPVSI